MKPASQRQGLESHFAKARCLINTAGPVRKHDQYLSGWTAQIQRRLNSLQATAKRGRYEFRNLPHAALRFKVGGFTLGNHGAAAGVVPIRLVARAGAAIVHPYWGKVVHDFAGMQHKNRIPIDYNHDDEQVIGYVDTFNTRSGDLELAGVLVPFSEGDRATEVVHKIGAGIPYEASIDFRDEIDVDELLAGQSRKVNGQDVEGPATVISRWTLRGVAVCPYGADKNTSAKL
jgi:hypothetical protein